MAEKKRHRSPNYPYLDLAEAINRLDLIYKQDRRSVTTAAAMLEHLGYSTSGKDGKSGSGGRAISALRQYGLIDDIDGNYRVSDSGFRMLNLDPNDPERADLIKIAASKPPLFQKVLRHYSFQIPSDTSLKSYLVVDEGFNPDSVNAFIRNLRKTIEFANLEEADYNSEDDGSAPFNEDLYTQIGEPMTTQEPRRTATVPGIYGHQPAAEAPDHIFSYQLSFPRNIRAEVKIYGKDLRKQDIERLQKEVGELAGAFDEEPTEKEQPVTEVGSTQ